MLSCLNLIRMGSLYLDTIIVPSPSSGSWVTISPMLRLAGRLRRLLGFCWMGDSWPVPKPEDQQLTVLLSRMLEIKRESDYRIYRGCKEKVIEGG
jgi:hypothetical protein